MSVRRASKVDKRTLACESYKALRDGPKTAHELPGNNFSPNPALRELVARLKSRGASSGSGKTRNTGQTYTVYFLWGDERRAIRKFIDVNTDYVRSCLADSPNPLSMNWDDPLLALLREEWDYRERIGGDD